MSPEALSALQRDADRYRFLRSRDCGPKGKTVPNGLFIGLVPYNVILTEDDADSALDRAMSKEP